jgi:hypothetical protein
VSLSLCLSASLSLSPHSRPFLSLRGLVLGPEACLLIQVHRVDISFKSETSYELVMPFRRPDRSWWGLVPLRIDSPYYTPEGSLLADKECNGAYANSGTHQIPLFNGLPPQHIIESSNPMEALLEKLLEQNNEVPSHSFSCSSGACAAVDTFSMDDDDTSRLVLSESGASALIRIQDQGMLHFINDHIKINTSLLPNTATLQQILETQINFSLKRRLFCYDPLRSCSEPSMKVLIPTRFHDELYLLTDAMNMKLHQDIQEYIDQLP